MKKFWWTLAIVLAVTAIYLFWFTHSIKHASFLYDGTKIYADGLSKDNIFWPPTDDTFAKLKSMNNMKIYGKFGRENIVFDTKGNVLAKSKYKICDACEGFVIFGDYKKKGLAKDNVILIPQEYENIIFAKFKGEYIAYSYDGILADELTFGICYNLSENKKEFGDLCENFMKKKVMEYEKNKEKSYTPGNIIAFDGKKNVLFSKDGEPIEEISLNFEIYDINKDFYIGNGKIYDRNTNEIIPVDWQRYCFIDNKLYFILVDEEMPEYYVYQDGKCQKMEEEIHFWNMENNLRGYSFGDKCGVVDATGKVLLKPLYYDVASCSPDKKDFIVMDRDNNCAVVGVGDEIIIPYSHKDISFFVPNPDLYLLTKLSDYSVDVKIVDRKGKEILSKTFDSYKMFEKYFVGKNDETYELYDKNINLIRTFNKPVNIYGDILFLNKYERDKEIDKVFDMAKGKEYETVYDYIAEKNKLSEKEMKKFKTAKYYGSDNANCGEIVAEYFDF